MRTEDSLNMWEWFFVGLEDENGKSKSGLSTFLNCWLIFHGVFCDTVFVVYKGKYI